MAAEEESGLSLLGGVQVAKGFEIRIARRFFLGIARRLIQNSQPPMNQKIVHDLVDELAIYAYRLRVSQADVP
jgi:hypothetical protein